MPRFSKENSHFLLFALLAGAAASLPADAQESQLPACLEGAVRHDCFGASTVNGDKYEGEWKNERPDGRGKMTSSLGWSYVGDFKGGKPNGHGTITFADGSNYAGSVKDGEPHGEGMLRSPSGLVYAGGFREGKREGQGAFGFPNGANYAGQVRNDQPNGQGKMVYPNGMEYEGSFKDGEFDGWGMQTFPNKTRYIGGFKNGRSNGEGAFLYATGAVAWKGLWADGKPVLHMGVPPGTTSSAAPKSPTAKQGYGTAFRIANGQFLTNHHIIDRCVTIKIDGKSGGRVVSSDPVKDLALVSLEGDEGEAAHIRTTHIQLNESVTVAGFPLQGMTTGIAVTNGSVNRLSGIRGDKDSFQLSAPTQQGNSGGPVLDASGNVIGVMTSSLNLVAGPGRPVQNMNFAVSGAALRGFLDAKSVSYKEVGNERELTGVQIAARATAFTVLVECR